MKMKLKTDLSGIPEKKQIELNHIVCLIHKRVPVDMIILFGKYAGGKMKSVLGGYELLLVTKKEPVDVYELGKWLKKTYHRAYRIEPQIFLYSYSETSINIPNSANYFFLNIRNEGVVLHDNGICHLFSRQKFKSTRAYLTASSKFEYYQKTSAIFLDHAQKAWEVDSRSIAALNLGVAAELLFKTIEAVFYGSTSTNPLVYSFLHTRHFSKQLFKLFNLSEVENKNLFTLLEECRHVECDDMSFSLPQKRYLFCMGKLRALQQIVNLICKQRLSILRKCHNKEVSID